MIFFGVVNKTTNFNPILTQPLQIFTRKGKLEANRLLQIFQMDYRDLMAWMTDLATRISSGEAAKNVREAEALLELHTERKVLWGMSVHCDGGLTLAMSALETLHGSRCTLSTLLIKPNYPVTPLPTQHQGFFRNLLSLLLSVLALSWLLFFHVIFSCPVCCRLWQEKLHPADNLIVCVPDDLFIL